MGEAVDDSKGLELMFLQHKYSAIPPEITDIPSHLRQTVIGQQDIKMGKRVTL